MNILDRIVLSTRKRVEREKGGKLPPAPPRTPFCFEQALRKQDVPPRQDIAFICEVKKASPSKGIIAEHFPYVEIAKEYEAEGAAAISVLTEPEFFLGSDSYLAEIRESVNLPLLRKDFTIDPFQIMQAASIGADAILLICAILSKTELSEFIKLSDSLGLSALVETHDEDEVKMAVDAGARIIGVNNRNLKTFEVDITQSEHLRELVPQDIIFISESGISTPEDIERLRKARVDAVLIGEILMKGAKIEWLRSKSAD